MRSFKHHNARSVKEALALLSRYGGAAKVNAGGTDLLGLLKERALTVYPEAVINLKTIEGLDYIEEDAQGLRIGATTKLAQVAASPVIAGKYRLLSEAALSVATPLVRNMATIGGNLAQDVRCWYYRYPHQLGGPIVCLRKPLPFDIRRRRDGKVPLRGRLSRRNGHTGLPDGHEGRQHGCGRPAASRVQPHARHNGQGLPHVLRT
jgi:hypothetical protein